MKRRKKKIKFKIFLTPLLVPLTINFVENTEQACRNTPVIYPVYTETVNASGLIQKFEYCLYMTKVGLFFSAASELNRFQSVILTYGFGSATLVKNFPH